MPDKTKHYDFAVVGAGIAGVSVAAELAKQASVIVLERETQPGYHSTGRSAAMYIPSYGPPAIQALTQASGSFFQNPPEEFDSGSLLSKRYEMLIATEQQLPELEQFYRDSKHNNAIQQLSAADVQQHCPLLKPGYACAGALDTSGSDIDVHRLLQGYLTVLKKHGGVLLNNAEVLELQHNNNNWDIKTPKKSVQATTVINASGAWADQLGELAGVDPIGLQAKRRTAITVDLPNFENYRHLPLTADITETFYIKPDAGRMLLSPANEDTMPPCDAQPEELDIAECIERIENAFTINVTQIAAKWAGLRSFVEDKTPVVGYTANNFFWLAGQGGYGIQSSPALSRYAAALALGNTLPADITAELQPDGLDVKRLG